MAAAPHETSADLPQRDPHPGIGFHALMPTACIQQPGTRIKLVSERLVVTSPDPDDASAAETRRDIPLRDLDKLVMGEGVAITTPALAEMLRRLIPISLTDRRGRFLGSFQPATPHQGAARLRHYQRALEPQFASTITSSLIAAKIYNQRRVVQRIAQSRHQNDQFVPMGIQKALVALENSAAKLTAGLPIESLRGHEGSSTATYFQAWASFFPADFPFERRSTRPPLNPVNAALSFTTTLIYHEMHSFIHARGLDPALGLLHTTENGRWYLALDLMEPFRPVVAEALTLDLFSRRMLNAKHFEPHDGGVYLTREGRAKLILQYEKRMERQFMSEHRGHRTTLRQQLDHQAVLIKRALDDPAVFDPFRMN